MKLILIFYVSKNESRSNNGLSSKKGKWSAKGFLKLDYPKMVKLREIKISMSISKLMYLAWYLTDSNKLCLKI